MKSKFKIITINKKILSIFLIIAILSCSILIYNAVFAKEPEGIKVPIIMYHSILKTKTGRYIVSPEKLEEDLKYVKEKGYTTVTMTDIIEYVYNDVTLPEKPIVLTFDDGYYNNYRYLYPLLEKYNMKAVISIVGSYTDRFTESNEANSNYSYLRWIDISMLIPEGRIEFQNHSYNMHTTANRKKWKYEKEERKCRRICRSSKRRFR